MKQKNKVIENKNVIDYEDEAKSHGTKRLVNYKVKQNYSGLSKEIKISLNFKL